jgi:hypothetical protein
MAFIRCREFRWKRGGTGKTYQLIETYREAGKVRQRILANLGAHATIEGAIVHALGFATVYHACSLNPQRGKFGRTPDHVVQREVAEDQRRRDQYLKQVRALAPFLPPTADFAAIDNAALAGISADWSRRLAAVNGKLVYRMRDVVAEIGSLPPMSHLKVTE